MCNYLTGLWGHTPTSFGTRLGSERIGLCGKRLPTGQPVVRAGCGVGGGGQFTTGDIVPHLKSSLLSCPKEF